MGMLVLSRKIGESIEIQTKNGEFIHLTLLSNEKGTSRIGFSASNDIVIHRTEIANKIRREKHNELVKQLKDKIAEDHLLCSQYESNYLDAI